MRLLSLAVAAAALLPGLASAQEWGFRAGGTARIEYTDNYFFSSANQQSGTTLTIEPFVTGYGRTENSQLNLFAAVGANQVWITDDNQSYLSGRFVLDGSTQQERSSYGFNVSALRLPTLQSQLQPAGVVLGLSINNALTAGVNYGYQLTERLDAGAFASWYSNSYDQLQANAFTQDNSGYSAGGDLGYAWSERTQLTLGSAYSYYKSDITTSNYVTASLAVAHQVSERLTVSANAGYFWSRIDAVQTGLVCPGAPILCQTGQLRPVPITVGSSRDDTGTLFGANMNYAISERTTFSANASQNITPSGVGVITKTSLIGASLQHAFTERLRGQVGASWTRTTYPAALGGSFSDDYYTAGASLSYSLTEEWLLDLGVRRARAEYSQTASRPEANYVFLSIAYNWPGQSISDWSGLGTYSFPGTRDTMGTPPAVTPGIPLGVPAPVPRSAD